MLVKHTRFICKTLDSEISKAVLFTDIFYDIATITCILC